MYCSERGTGQVLLLCAGRIMNQTIQGTASMCLTSPEFSKIWQQDVRFFFFFFLNLNSAQLHRVKNDNLLGTTFSVTFSKL